MSERDIIRRTFLAFKSGALLHSADISRLLAKRGIHLSNNRLRELGRDSDRGLSITSAELYELISAWAEEQRSEPPPPDA